MDYLLEISKLCKCSVTVEINSHRDYYLTAEQEIVDNIDLFSETEEEIINKMIELDTIISITCYNKTPIGSYQLHHYDLELALKEMHKALINLK